MRRASKVLVKYRFSFFLFPFGSRKTGRQQKTDDSTMKDRSHKSSRRKSRLCESHCQVAGDTLPGLPRRLSRGSSRRPRATVPARYPPPVRRHGGLRGWIASADLEQLLTRLRLWFRDPQTE